MQQRDPRKRVVTTKLAMEIVGLSASRFNEFVATGLYECAPATRPGKARRFREADLIALYWFVQMMGKGIERAGNIACRLGQHLKEHAATDGLYNEGRVAFIECYGGSSFFKGINSFAADLAAAGSERLEYAGHGIMKSSEIFDLAHVREIIAEKIEEWDNEAGDDDE